MKYIAHALFVAGIATIIYTIILSLSISNPDWLLFEATGLKLTAIAFFVSAVAARFIFADRTNRTDR